MNHQPLSARAVAPWRRRTLSDDGRALVPSELPWRARHSRMVISLSRTIDLALAGSLLLVLAIPMLIVALLVKLTSRGPIIYRQQRVGLGGRSFTMYKFRTMRVDAEAHCGPVWSTSGDTRCTPVGSLLRRSSLDELPQLVNVLKGEMSLVGPRPERPYFVREFSGRLPHYSRRLQVLPGLTGWAQVNGWRGDTSLESRLDHDLYYVEHWSIAFNLRIILLTPFRILAQQRGTRGPAPSTGRS